MKYHDTFFCDRTFSEQMREWNEQKEDSSAGNSQAKSIRILLTGDIHCTDLEAWYGVSDQQRVQHWVDFVKEEHARHPFDAFLILGDISLDYHANKTPYDKGYSTGKWFMDRYFSQLPQDIPRFILAGNHEQFPHEDWLALTGNERQGTVVVGNNTFVMLDNYSRYLGPVCDHSDTYTPVDLSYIREQIEKYPENRVFLCSHYFDPAQESEGFRQLLKTEQRIKGLFMGHTHLCKVIELGEAYRHLSIAQIGNFSFSDDLNEKESFWGIRDLVIDADRAVSRYYLAESEADLHGEWIHVPKHEVDICEYAF